MDLPCTLSSAAGAQTASFGISSSQAWAMGVATFHGTGP
jgi:hypothetical protein